MLGRSRFVTEALVDALHAYLDAESDIRAMSDGQALLHLIHTHHVDVIVICDDHGLSARQVQQLRDLQDRGLTRVLVLEGATRGAPRGFAQQVPDADGLSGVLTALTAVSALDVSSREPEAVGRSGQPDLSRREAEVLRRIAAGRRAADIAHDLGISINTVETHKRRIFVKLGVQSQAQAVATALKSGLLWSEDQT